MRKALLAASALASVTLAPLTSARAEVFDTAAIIELIRNTVAGFTQTANYLKGQIAAQQQIADGSNTAMARFQRNVRSAQIRDEHIATPAACESLDNGQAITIGAGQSWIVATSLTAVANRRREAGPDTPAWHGEGQAAADRARLHRNRYCSELEAAEGVCQLTDRPNGDVRSASMTGGLSYGPRPENINAAIDFSIMALQPVPLRALRGDELRAAQSQDIKLWRDRYLANMSLAQDVHTRYIARRAETVTLTPAQRAQQQAQGLVVTERGSWLQAAELEVNRRMSGRAWNAAIWRMPPASVLREMASMQALGLHLQLESLRVQEDVANTSAALLAARVESDTGRPQDAFKRLTTLPTPQVR